MRHALPASAALGEQQRNARIVVRPIAPITIAVPSVHQFVHLVRQVLLLHIVQSFKIMLVLAIGGMRTERHTYQRVHVLGVLPGNTGDLQIIG